ncbi:MAG TPA: chorismate mutase [Streptosporangiaceae bacterium]|nr:chorismate mutase [Streptosporangiaceae bacterium]
MINGIEIESQIEEYRRTIDGLDMRIIELLNQRARISGLIQQCRINSGGPRTVFSREMAILARYQEKLGAVGPQIAMNVLELCRGGDPVEPPTPTGTRENGRTAMPENPVSRQGAAGDPL